VSYIRITEEIKQYNVLMKKYERNNIKKTP